MSTMLNKLDCKDRGYPFLVSLPLLLMFWSCSRHITCVFSQDLIQFQTAPGFVLGSHIGFTLMSGTSKMQNLRCAQAWPIFKNDNWLILSIMASAGNRPGICYRHLVNTYGLMTSAFAWSSATSTCMLYDAPLNSNLNLAFVANSSWTLYFDNSRGKLAWETTTVLLDQLQRAHVSGQVRETYTQRTKIIIYPMF